MTLKIARTAYKNIFRNMRRSILSGAAIAVSAMSIVMLFAFIDGMTDDMENNLKNYYTGDVRVRNVDYEKYERFNPVHLSVDLETAKKALSGIEYIEAWVPRTTFPANLYIDGTNFGAAGTGADFKMESRYIDLESILKSGTLPAYGRNEMLIGSVLARNLDLNIGDKVTVMATTAARGTNAITLKITGLAAFPVASLNAASFWMPLDRAQYFLKMPGEVQEILIKTNEDIKPKDASRGINTAFHELNTELDVRALKEISSTFNMLSYADLIYNVVAVFFFLLGSTVIINTTMMVIFERMREIGTLSALGMQDRELTKLFLLEGTFISAAGAAVGVLIGVLLVLYLGKTGMDFTDAMSGVDMEISSVLYPSLNIPRTIFVYFYSVIVASLATLIPSRKASKIEPVEALRYI